MNTLRKLLLSASLTLIGLTAHAKVISSSADHYVLKHTATSSMTPEEVWQRLIQPATWWHPDHTYSGDSNNLALDLKAGGYWSERWAENAVLHGTVLNVIHAKLLRLDAPFGPLQGMAVDVVWTISIEATKGGSIVSFEELANGTAMSQLDKLATPVDQVKSQALARLVKNKAVSE